MSAQADHGEVIATSSWYDEGSDVPGGLIRVFEDGATLREEWIASDDPEVPNVHRAYWGRISNPAAVAELGWAAARQCGLPTGLGAALDEEGA